ncbi:Glyoxylate reductase/hydroxypyruvate reductase, partial [Aphelenchoides avenae]
MNREAKVVVTDASVKVPMLREIANVHQWEQPGQMPREQLLKELRDTDALFCLLHDRIDKEVLDAAPKLKIIGTMSVGHEHIDLEECKRRGISVGYTPDVLTEATAELTVALTLATSRRIVEAANSAKTYVVTDCVNDRCPFQGRLDHMDAVLHVREGACRLNGGILRDGQDRHECGGETGDVPSENRLPQPKDQAR